MIMTLITLKCSWLDGNELIITQIKEFKEGVVTERLDNSNVIGAHKNVTQSRKCGGINQRRDSGELVVAQINGTQR